MVSYLTSTRFTRSAPVIITFVSLRGSGKSVFFMELAVSLMAQNTRMFILDIGQSFANICTLLNGEIIRFGRGNLISLNPFASFDKGMDPDDKDEFLKCAKGLLEVMCASKDDARGSAELEKAIVAALTRYDYALDISSFAAGNSHHQLFCRNMARPFILILEADYMASIFLTISRQAKRN